MSPQNEIRVFLVDDHTVVREAVRDMLDAEPDMKVVGDSGKGAEAIEAIVQVHPHVAIVDIKMPEMGGLELIREIRAKSPKTQILVFTMYDNATYVSEALRRGAAGYVLKSINKRELLKAIRTLRDGGGFLQAEVAKPLLRQVAVEARLDAKENRLTVRELETLELLAEGKTNKEVANLLTVSDETVKTHLRHLYEKLGAADRAHAVAIAFRLNLIE
jgi:DNA-binding NarL/FixJ family response regulator